MSSEVPQSDLGPVLFHLLTNDPELEMNSVVARFADDTIIQDGKSPRLTVKSYGKICFHWVSRQQCGK